MNGQFDQTVRPLAKADGKAFFEWALSCCPGAPRLTFVKWEDARRLVDPGQSDRYNDLVALCHEDDSTQEVWMVGEIKSVPVGNILYTMGLYEIALGQEVNPHCLPDGPLVGSLVLNLSGTQTVRFKEAPWGQYGNRLAPLIVDAAAQDAVATLKKIEDKKLGLSIAPLLALMSGGGSREFIQRWKDVVGEREKDPLVLARMREAAIVCAELTKYQVDWINQTEDWLVLESQYIRGWMNEGGKEATRKTKQQDLLMVIERLEDPVSDDLRRAVEGTKDIEVLDRWFKTAVFAKDIAELRKAMNPK